LRRAPIVEEQEAGVDRTRIRLQLRFVQVALNDARSQDRAQMASHASEILDLVAEQIESDPNPELVQLLAEVRAAAESAARQGD
jgi:hypothetical protein